MINYIKKHKLTFLIIVIYILLIGVAYFLYSLFLGSNGLPVYGSRLDGIEKVKIIDKQFNNIESEIKKNPFVLSITKPYLSGKILKVVVHVDYSTAPENAKKIGDQVLSALTDEQKKFFDIEILIDKYYDCNLVVSGKADENGIFIEPVTVKFKNDLSKNKYTLNYGVTNANKKDYNKKQEYKIEKDGEYIIYGFTQDKSAEQVCSIKVVKKSTKKPDRERTINTNSLAEPAFPVIGYRSAKSAIFKWIG